MRSNLHSLSLESFRHARNEASDVPNVAQPKNQILRGETEPGPGKILPECGGDRVLLVHFDRTGMEFVPLWNAG